jgi:hypothetical protein
MTNRLGFRGRSVFGPCEGLFQYLSGETEETNEISRWVTRSPAKIPTRYHQNTRLQWYHYTNVLFYHRTDRS